MKAYLLLQHGRQVVWLQWHQPISARSVSGGFHMFVCVPACCVAPQHVSAQNQDLVYIPRVETLTNKKLVPSLVPEELVAQPDSDLAHTQLTASRKRKEKNRQLCKCKRDSNFFQHFPEWNLFLPTKFIKLKLSLIGPILLFSFSVSFFQKCLKARTIVLRYLQYPPPTKTNVTYSYGKSILAFIFRLHWADLSLPHQLPCNILCN